MTTMISKVYRAFIKAGVPEEDARGAAEARSTENPATKKDTVRLERNMAVLKWMAGATLAGVVAVIVQTFLRLSAGWHGNF